MDFDWGFAWDVFLSVWAGAPVSVGLVVATLVLGLPLGYLLAVLRFKRAPVGRQVSALYVSFIRGTPMIVQIYIAYNLLPSLLNMFFKQYNIEVNIFDVPNLIYGIIVFALNTAAISSEAFRGSLASIDKGQMEAAVSIGMTSWQAYRRIIIPQTLVSALPNLCSITVNLFKGTTLVFIMSIQDITAIAKTAAGRTYKYLEAYLVIFIVYLIFCFAIEKLFKAGENKLRVFKGTPA